MSSAESKIQEAATKNKELLSILQETDYAPAALEQQQAHINDLNNSLGKLNSKIQTLTSTREKELKDHEKYQSSVLKRFAYRIGRQSEKFDDKAEKEEREYFDALHAEHQAKKQQDSLQSDLANAEKQRKDLETAASRHQKAQADLDALYDSIFEGPTPGFPDEDAVEKAAQDALQSYQDLSRQFEGEQRALQLLSQARSRLGAAVEAMGSARSSSRMDMFGGNNMIWDMMERNSLSEAENYGANAQDLIMQAKRMSPHVGEVPHVEVAKGGFMGDIMFDNPFSDHKFHQKIKASEEEMAMAMSAVDGECARSNERLGGLKGALGEEQKKLDGKRVELQQARERAFEKVAGGKA